MHLKSKVQVNRDHYFKHYDSLHRFISYFYQIDSVRSLKDINSILEVGIGNKTINNYLKNQGYNITSCDFDKNLQPDIVADVRNLPFKDNSYDVALCFEVLEHIPLGDLPNAITELSRVSKRYVIISIPYYCAYFELWGKMSLGYFSKALDLALAIPYFFIKPKFTGEHYWGLGIKNISKRDFRKHLHHSNLKIIKEFREKFNPHHYFFILEKVV